MALLSEANVDECAGERRGACCPAGAGFGVHKAPGGSKWHWDGDPSRSNSTSQRAEVSPIRARVQSNSSRSGGWGLCASREPGTWVQFPRARVGSGVHAPLLSASFPPEHLGVSVSHS